MSQELEVLDLDAEREARLAKLEVTRKPLPIKWRGNTICTLPPELPFDVIAPLGKIDADLSLIMRQAVSVARNNGQSVEDRLDAAELVIDLLAANAHLPQTILTVVKEMAAAVLTEEGLAEYLDGKPSIPDMVGLARGVVRYYGVGLGEASPSSVSSETGGAISNSTSSENSTDSTPGDSLQTPAPIAS
jgi:hypothetical protein